MAGSVGTTVPSSWDTTLDTLQPYDLFKRAQAGEDRMVRRVIGEPDFVVTGRMDVSGESLTAIDFTALGVTFAAGTQRVIEIEVHFGGATVATESGYIHKRECIVGGTTPTLGIVIGAIDTNMAGAVGGFTVSDPTVTFTMATNNVTVVLVNEGATETNNFVLKAYVSRAQDIPAGV